MVVYNTVFSDINIDYLRKNGLGAEILQYSDPVFLDDFNNNHPKITQYMQGMSGVSMHGAYYDLFYTSKDPLIREVAEKRFLQCIQAAVFHSIDRIVFHSSYRNAFDGFSKATIDNFLKRSAEFWFQFEKCIPEDITIYLENVDDDDPEVFVQIIERIGSNKISCCLDVGHVHCSSAVPVDRWVDVLGSHIGHVHLHDNNGESDQHLPLGKGSIPLLDTINAILKRAGKDIPFVLECDASESVEWLKNSGFELSYTPIDNLLLS